MSTIHVDADVIANCCRSLDALTAVFRDISHYEASPDMSRAVHAGEVAKQAQLLRNELNAWHGSVDAHALIHWRSGLNVLKSQGYCTCGDGKCESYQEGMRVCFPDAAKGGE